MATHVSRPDRVIYPPARLSEGGQAGVFLGIYGDRWVTNAIASIEQQGAGPLEVVAAVNGPTASAVGDLIEWQAKTSHAVTVVTNDRNLGPVGSWYLNRDLLQSPWIALFHQDDVYLPDHLTNLIDEARRAPEDVMAIFGAMSGIDDRGQPLAAPPMDNNSLNLAPTATTLPAILRRHPLPTPAVMLRNPQGYVDGLAWYDSGAPDSEWFARLACRGRFRILDSVTVHYRSSPGSESQSTGWQSRAWQWAHSLDRLIHSDDFALAMAQLPESERQRFAGDLLAAIPARYPTSPVFDFLAFAAAQRMATIWNYETGPATELVAKTLGSEPASAAARNIAGITGSEIGVDLTGHEGALTALLNQAPERGRLEESGRAVYRRYGHLLPKRARLGAYRLYDRLWSTRGAR